VISSAAALMSCGTPDGTSTARSASSSLATEAPVSAAASARGTIEVAW
jgi:hypothetical protein